jgi:polysaccharide biosynthesis transport protein
MKMTLGARILGRTHPSPARLPCHITGMSDFDQLRGWERGRGVSDEQSLVRYYRILRERWWVVVACTILAVVAALVYVKTAPKTYQAQAVMEVQAASPTNTVLSTLPVLLQTGDPTEDVLTGASYVTTIPVATAVVHALNLKISPSSALGDISSSPIGQASLVAVVATSSSPQLAASLATEFVRQTIITTTATMHATIATELPLLQKQLLTIPPNQRNASALAQTIDEYQLLQTENNPTLRSQAPAAVPTSPSSPKTKLTLIAGLFAGLLLGIGGVFAMHALDPRLRQEEQLRARLDIPILARIPRDRRRGALPMLPTELSVTSREGYRTLRTTLTLRRPANSSGAYLVTGSSPSEGKSTTALSLAVSLAQGGRRVILIEADFRKPTFARTLGLTAYYGTEQVLIGEVELPSALEIVRLESTSIRVLAAHHSGVTIADRLSSAIVRKLITNAKAIADDVVIDSPPLTEVIDALPFAQYADEVLIVARLGHSRINRLVELDDLLAQQGVVRSGIVLIGETHHARQYYYAPDPEDQEALVLAPSRSRSSRRVEPTPQDPGRMES